MGRIVPDQVASGQVPAVASTGTINEQTALTTIVAGPQSTGKIDQKLAQTSAANLSLGTSGRSMAVSLLSGSETVSMGTRGASMATSTVGSETTSLGSTGRSLSASSNVLAIGYVTTATTVATSGNNAAFSNPTNVEADDSAVATWNISDALGGGTGTTSTGSLTATNPKVATATPTGWTRAKVETLIHRNDAAVGLNATGDTASLTVVLQDKTGAALQTVLTDTFTAAGSKADATVATDVTAAVAGVSDSDLALTKLVCTISFARTLAATGTRSWTVNVDSLALRITYTRSGIS